MPAWSARRGAAERFLGCKIVTVFPDNAAAGQPSLHGSYLLMSGATGAPLALMDAARAHRMAHRGGLGARRDVIWRARTRRIS